MQAVVLMAGKGTRMAKFFAGPKQLLPVAGKPILEHVLDTLPAEIDEIIAVVGGPHEARLREYLGENYKGRPVNFALQAEQLGLAHAFNCARHLVSGRWLGMIADDVLGPKDLTNLVAEDIALLAHRVATPENFGVLVTDGDGYLERSVEKPEDFISDLVWTGHMVMDEKFFAAKVPPSARGEYETPDVWMKLISDFDVHIKVVEAEFWLPINDKQQLEEAERVLQNAAKGHKKNRPRG